MKTQTRKRTRGPAMPPVGVVESTVDKSVRAVEDVHRSISDLPFNVLQRLGVLEQTASEVKRIHDTSVAAIYETVRDVNHRVAKLADDLFDRDAELRREGASRRTAA